MFFNDKSQKQDLWIRFNYLFQRRILMLPIMILLKLCSEFRLNFICKYNF
jgi:hypothetical protein